MNVLSVGSTSEQFHDETLYNIVMKNSFPYKTYYIWKILNFL